MKLVAQHVAHKDDDCTFELDEYRTDAGEPMLLAHLRVHQSTPSAFRRVQKAWADYRSKVTTPLYALPQLPPNDPAYEKWVRFVQMMGWRPTGQHVGCLDGIKRPLFIHTV